MAWQGRPNELNPCDYEKTNVISKILTRVDLLIQSMGVWIAESVNGICKRWHVSKMSHQLEQCRANCKKCRPGKSWHYRQKVLPTVELQQSIWLVILYFGRIGGFAKSE